MCCAQAARTRGLRADGFSRDDLRRVGPQKNQLTEVNCPRDSRDFKIMKRPATLDQASPNCSDFFFGKPRLNFSSQLEQAGLV